MRVLLRSYFPNGPFGDPALYVFESSGRGALLFDCGDLSRFTTRQLLRVSHIFLSHCHIDHFFGFDHYLRVHMSSEKVTTLVGPPHTSDHVWGKLRGYTWNLITDRNLSFRVLDLDSKRMTKTTTWFRAQDTFHPTDVKTENWLPDEAILDNGSYQVSSATIDHRTPSIAYLIEEKPFPEINSGALRSLGYRPGEWIETLKNLFLFGSQNEEPFQIEVTQTSGKTVLLSSRELMEKVIVPRKRNKIAYVTDGAPSEENRQILSEFLFETDELYCETCFLKKDLELAEKTKHFTAEFIGALAQKIQVKKLIPFHFSKRYFGEIDQIKNEIALAFSGEIIPLSPSSPILRL